MHKALDKTLPHNCEYIRIPQQKHDHHILAPLLCHLHQKEAPYNISFTYFMTYCYNVVLPTGTGKGGASIYGKYFDDEIVDILKVFCLAFIF